MRGCWWLRLLSTLWTAVLAVHIADNGDGTFTNPVMPNAHWSDPSALRHGNAYFVVTSSIETTPSLQVSAAEGGVPLHGVLFPVCRSSVRCTVF